ncbi:MAG: TIGR00282 family metallophosphoesterase [Clostridia bacterium]|nr:TIGR00282 family metallophosphoesterase [Clostridia bacterium]
MNILAIGDVVGEGGCEFLRSKLPSLKKDYSIDLVIANGENSAKKNGISRESMNHIFNSGVDVITTGNHCFQNHQIYDCFENEPFLLRPANYPPAAVGRGYCIVDMLKYKVCVINLMGVVFMENLNCPFVAADEIIKKVKNEAAVIIVDLHAEATSEKAALAHYLDGRISALFGTHTHVQTADEKILPKKTGFITDIGMTGPIDSILGVKKENIIRKMKDKLPTMFVHAEGLCRMDCAVFTINEKDGSCQGIKRLSVR